MNKMLECDIDRARAALFFLDAGCDRSTWIRIGMSAKAASLSETVRDVVDLVGDEYRFDSAVSWLNALPAHDGVERCETFLTTHFGVEDSAYTRAVSRYLWSAMAGRTLEPGCKADMVPILCGPQGLGKSSGIAAMAPSAEHFCEISLGDRDDALARLMRGKLLGEIAELRGMQTREIEAIKAFVTRQHEQWIPKYKEHAKTYPRRLVFVGTANESELLADSTGNRRWLPVSVTRVDRNGIVCDREQLWAEAKTLFQRKGVCWQEAQTLAPEVHKDHMVSDSWSGTVIWWLEHKASGAITTNKILTEAIGLRLREIKRPEEMRVGKIMAQLGYEKGRRMVDGERSVFWFKQ